MSLETTVQTTIDDFEALEREIRRELFEKGAMEIQAVMESGGYLEELEVMRNRISSLVEAIKGLLKRFSEGLSPGAEPSDDGDVQKNRIHEMRSLLESLLATWERLINLVDIVAQRAAGAAALGAGVLSKVRSWLSTMMNWIKRISGQLWQLLCGLLKPKEWSLTGKVGTGPFGLADVSVEITFGP